MAEQVGQHIPTGVAMGIDKTADVPATAARNMAQGVLNAARGVLVSGGPSVAVTGQIGDQPASSSTTAGAGGITISNLTLNLNGIVDLTDPNAMSTNARKMVYELRNALRVVEGQYA
jgi:hypothetical protein